MSSKTSIFLIGASGYIGGSVLGKLLAHPKRDTFDITVIVRGEEKAKKFEQLGVKAAVGSFKDDLEKLEKLVEEAHVVFSCADADDPQSVKAILKGMKNRHAKHDDLPVLIHTSGTAILTHEQDTGGMAPTDLIYDDSNFEQIANISPEAPHRNVDNEIFAADKEGYLRAYFILPSTIYAISDSPVAKQGLQNPHSQQIPFLIKAALARGRPGMVGKGLARWPDVHIDDVSDLYMVIYDNVVSKGTESVDHGVRGYYFGENGEHSWYDISKAIGKAMVELGLSKTDEPDSFTNEELIKYFGSEAVGRSYGTNSRCKATHSRALGWKPKYTTHDMLASIKPEIEALIKQEQEKKR